MLHRTTAVLYISVCFVSQMEDTSFLLREYPQVVETLKVEGVPHFVLLMGFKHMSLETAEENEEFCKYSSNPFQASGWKDQCTASSVSNPNIISN